MIHVIDELRQNIRQDIIDCEHAMKDSTAVGLNSFHNRLILKYSDMIDGFTDNLQNITFDEYGFKAKANIEAMKKRMQIFVDTGYQSRYPNGKMAAQKNFRNVVSNEVLFAKAVQKIEVISSIGSEDAANILEKISQLYALVESSDEKEKKWRDASEIIKWLAETDYDVGITFIPLLFRIR